MRRAYFVLSILLLVAVAAQFYFAGVGAFTKPQTDSSYSLHAIDGGMVIPLLSIIATIVAAIAKAPGRLIGHTIAPVVLVIVQFLIIGLGDALGDGDRTTPLSLVVYGLHAINGLAILVVAGLIMRGARQFMVAGAAGGGAAAGTDTAGTAA